VDPDMTANLEYMRRLTTATCPHCNTIVGLDDLVRDIVWRPGSQSAVPNSRNVEAQLVRIESEDYVPFDRLSDEQAALRSVIRAGVQALAAEPDEVLHAIFLGDKPPRADVENLLVYNIGAAYLRAASRHGLRFEITPGDSGLTRRFGYQYELEDRATGFRYWKTARRLVCWDRIDIGQLDGGKTLEHVWLALRCGRCTIEGSRSGREVPFAVRVAIRPPAGRSAAPATMIKGVLDGVIAFQAHTDATTVPDLANRLTRTLTVSEDELQDPLLDVRQAALGALPRLLHARGPGVAWAPADDYCLAGELLLDAANGNSWSISGVIDEIAPR
jgi:hypothetical protein